MPVREDLIGLVLTGGESKRMGVPKALLLYEGVPMYLHAARTLQKVCKVVVFSHRSDRFMLPDTKEWQVMEDDSNIGGPMAGLLSALEKSKHPVFCLPCDTPFAGETEIRYLLEKRDKTQFCTVFYNQENGFYEPLIGIWEISAIPVLRDNLMKGQFSLQKILKDHQIRKNQTPRLSALKNFNTPEDWENLS